MPPSPSNKNPAAWRVALTVVAADHVAAFEDALAPLGGAVAAMEEASGGGWRIEAVTVAAPDRAEVTARIALAAAILGIDAPDATLEPVPDTDWVREVQRRTPPVQAGRFHLRGSHLEAPVPVGAIGIVIDAGAAFGTGSHESTRGCLIAFDRLAARLRVAAGLDLGCGSGILAIAAAKLWRAPVLAADSDAVAVAVAAGNATANGVSELVTAIRSQGFRNPAIRARAPFDLIAANIVARPLMGMAPALARRLAPGGAAVLSGLLAGQGDGVAAAYGDAGLAEVERIALGDWITLVVARK